MQIVLRVAMLGFSAFERSTLASYFRLAANRQPSYRQVQLLHEADLVIADADHAPSVQLVLATERLAETVFVGQSPPDGAAATTPRPIDALKVLRQLDALATQRRECRAAASDRTQPGRHTLVLPRPTGQFPSPRPVQPPRPPQPMHDGQAIVAPRRVVAGVPSAPLAPGARSLAASTALLVDDSEVALRFLQRKLARYALHVECAANSRHAMQKLAERHFDLVFMDIELGDASELDGLGLCQRIKRRGADGDAAATSVIMVSAHHAETDRMRGVLAGCDAFLGKPLEDAELARVLARHGLQAAPARRPS